MFPAIFFHGVVPFVAHFNNKIKMNNMKSFKESLEKVIIPGIKRMILEEQEHITTLNQYDIPSTKDMIGHSMLVLSQLKARLMEYEDYLDNMNKEQNA